VTAIVTGTDGLRYVHEMAGEAPVFVTETARTASQPRAAIAGHARLVAWLVPLEAGEAQRARVRLPAGEIVEVTGRTVFSAANIAWAGIAPAHRYPAAARRSAPQTRPWQCLYFLPEPQGQGALRGVAAQVEGSAGSTSAATSGARAPWTAVP